MPKINPSVVGTWIAEQLARDDLVSGRVPGFRIVDRSEIRSSNHLQALHKRDKTSIEIPLPLKADIVHELEEAASGVHFVQELAALMLADAEGPPAPQLTNFEAKLLVPFVPKVPAAIIFPIWLRDTPALQTYRVPVTFSEGLSEREVVLVERRDQVSRYTIGDGDLKDESPNFMRVFLPTLLYRIGSERPRVQKLIIANPESIAIPRHGRLPF